MIISQNAFDWKNKLSMLEKRKGLPGTEKKEDALNIESIYFLGKKLLPQKKKKKKKKKLVAILEIKLSLSWLTCFPCHSLLWFVSANVTSKKYLYRSFYFKKKVRGAYNKFPDFFVWTLLLIVHAWNSSPLPSNLLRLRCTCCTAPTTSGRPLGSPLVWTCQGPSSQPRSSPQLSHNDSL